MYVFAGFGIQPFEQCFGQPIGTAEFATAAPDILSGTYLSTADQQLHRFRIHLDDYFDSATGKCRKRTPSLY